MHHSSDHSSDHNPLANLPELLTPAEAAALLCRPTRGKKIHTSSIIRWGKQRRFQLEWCNGWKVGRDSFIAWARETYRLRGSSRPANSVARQSHKARRQRQQANTIYLNRILRIAPGTGFDHSNHT